MCSDPEVSCLSGEDIPDIVFFDLETQRTFEEVGGRDHIRDLGLAVAVTYSTRDRRYDVFWESEAAQLVERLHRSQVVVGFNLFRFDYVVLQPYVSVDFARLRTLDMLDQVYRTLGFRVSLDALARETLGEGKTADGLQAVRWFREGNFDLLVEYCRHDVQTTMRLFEYGLREGVLFFRDRRTGSRRSVRAPWATGELDRLYRRAVG